jgi:3-deoxy-D-manno-octulosonate 8-phosphate phosphatase (KDO 8-P phosphatase)
MVMMDVDGVLTDGRIVLDARGGESKSFFSQDGVALRLWSEAGGLSAFVTGRASRAVERRARELEITELSMNSSRKLEAYERICRRHRLSDEEVCFIGDDLVDLAPMRRAGFPVAVRNAVDEVKRVARYVTRLRGGEGAVRETLRHILVAQRRWTGLLRRFQA